MGKSRINDLVSKRIEVDGVVLDAGNAVFPDGKNIEIDIVNEATSGGGVIIDGVLLKDNAVTASGGSGFNAGGITKDVGTFGLSLGDNIVLKAYQGKWLILSSVNVTLL